MIERKEFKTELMTKSSFFFPDSNSDSNTPKSVDKLIIDPIQSKQVFAQHFDTTCDICSVELKTLKRAISHYKHQHKNDEGYVKCCGLKLKRDKLVDDHIQWHLNPEIFKSVDLPLLHTFNFVLVLINFTLFIGFLDVNTAVVA